LGVGLLDGAVTNKANSRGRRMAMKKRKMPNKANTVQCETNPFYMAGGENRS
jgi:hypothetical protein